jgi:hypothetical protein
MRGALPFPSDPCLRVSRAIVGTVFDSGTRKNCSDGRATRCNYYNRLRIPPCTIQAIETVCGLRTQAGIGVEPGTLSTLLRFGGTKLARPLTRPEPGDARSHAACSIDCGSIGPEQIGERGGVLDFDARGSGAPCVTR